MKLRSYFKYVEIQTKAASMIPFVFGTLLAFFKYRVFNSLNFLLMLVSLLAFDMGTTAINNYCDYKRARKKSGFGYEKYNAIVRDNIKESEAFLTIVFLLLIAVSAGILLFLNTDYVVLLIGAVSFMVGVLYSAGPVPISRTPFGEVFSGLFMGFFIPFVSIYIHVFDQEMLTLTLAGHNLTVGVNISDISAIFLCSVPGIAGIANIMLANNICDMEDDLENNRFTLPIYIGKEKSLILFKCIYYSAYIAVVLACLFKILPYISLLFLLTCIPLRKNIRIFSAKQSKNETFALSVQNFAIMNVSLILTLVIALGWLLLKGSV